LNSSVKTTLVVPPGAGVFLLIEVVAVARALPPGVAVLGMRTGGVATAVEFRVEVGAPGIVGSGLVVGSAGSVGKPIVGMTNGVPIGSEVNCAATVAAALVTAVPLT
jgi:hypothetical protein